MIKKILPYALILMLGATTAYGKTGIQIGRDKTPKSKVTQAQVQKSSPTASGLENKIVEIPFFYRGKTNPTDADKTVSGICPEVSKILDKKVDCERFGNWVKTKEEKYGPKDVSDTLVVDKEKGSVCFKETDNCFTVSDLNQIKQTYNPQTQTKPDEQKSSGLIKYVKGGVGTIGDFKGWSAGVGLPLGLELDYIRGTNDYGTKSDLGSQSGKRFDFIWGSTLKSDGIKENASLNVYFMNLKNSYSKLGLSAGISGERTTINSTKWTMEKILNKSGEVITEDSNSLAPSTIKDEAKVRAGASYTLEKGLLKGLGVEAAEYFGEGGTTEFSGQATFTYSF